MFPGERGTIECLMPQCGMWVPDVEAHLKNAHTKTELAEYMAEFPGAPLKGQDLPEDGGETDKRLTVSADEARRHPCGRDGAIMEKAIPRGERRGYREGIINLLAMGYAPGYRVASIAYKQLLIARCRLDIEAKRTASNGAIIPGETFDLLERLEKSVATEYRDIEREREARAAGMDPMDVIQNELNSAEQFIRENQGELVEACPSCNMPLHPPGLPYWCFAPLKTRYGTEWIVWSQELWSLVLSGEIRLWQMSFALRLSPEGVKMIAARRGEDFPVEIDLAEEERLLRLELNRQDLESQYQLAPRAPVMEVEQKVEAEAAPPAPPAPESPPPADAL